jgi:ParB family chromosome partitioning protein
METAPATPTTSEKPKRGLGRGLDALFADAEQRIESREENVETSTGENSAPLSSTNYPLPSNGETSGITPSIGSGTRQLPIAILIPGAFQPRRKFDEMELQALAESIRAHGILQPLLVRVSPAHPGKFEIIAGERRWRAAGLAQLHEVPVVIRDFNDRAALEIGLIENIQRADLTPIEEAEGYQRLMHEFGHTQEALSDIVGKSRAHLANTLRLLTLPESVRQKIHTGLLSSGHARQLVGISNAELLAETAIEKHWSVRDLERQVRAQKRGIRPDNQETNAGRPAKNSTLSPLANMDHAVPKDADVLALENEMSNLLGLKVDIQSMLDSSGVLSLYFSSLDQLDELLQKLTRAAKH